MAADLASPAFIQVDQSCSKPLHNGTGLPSTEILRPSHTSTPVNTYGGRRFGLGVLDQRGEPLRATSQTEKEPSACAYTTRAGIDCHALGVHASSVRE